MSANGRHKVNHAMWHLFDGRKQRVGRMATELSRLLMGKHKPTWSPNLDHGDNVVVVNARHMVLTGRKYEQKLYKWHTGFPGGLKSMTPKVLTEKKGHPEEIIVRAVNGMLPKNNMRRMRMTRLFVYNDAEHPHAECFSQEEQTRIADMLAGPPPGGYDDKFEVEPRFFDIVDGKVIYDVDEHNENPIEMPKEFWTGVKKLQDEDKTPPNKA